MLRVTDIEASNYSINDVADLKMRLTLLVENVNFAIKEIENQGDNCELNAHRILINAVGQSQTEHNCEIVIGEKGDYGCKCGLVASAE